MGVIKKNNPKLGKFADSQESLHINQHSEDDDVSSTSDVSEPSHPVLLHNHARFLPVPMSFSNGRKVVGKKRYRRYENVHHLETLVENEELQAVTIYDFIPDINAGFSRVLENGDAKDIWESFLNSSEEAQKQVTESHIHFSNRKVVTNLIPQTPEEAFSNIKTGLRNTLKKTHVPLGILGNLERSIVEFFSASPADIFISDQLNSFERLLLHAIAQYYSLRSLSFNPESNDVRLVKVLNPQKLFHPPSMLLANFLDERKKKTATH